MKKGILRLVVFSLVLAAILTSCAVDSKEEGIDVQFSITNDRTRTISSDSEHLSITKYKFTLSGAADLTKTFDKNDTGKYVIEGVKAGSYTVKVEGLTAVDAVISEGSETLYLERAESEKTMKSFTITLSTLSGKQKANIVYKWNKDSYSTPPTLKLDIYDQNGDAVSLSDGEFVNDASNGKATLTKDFNAGSYIFIAKLANGNTVHLGHTEVFRFTNSSSMLSTEIDLTSGGSVSSESIIEENIALPIEATIVTEWENTSILKVSLNITSMPDGITASDIKVKWYNEHITWHSSSPTTADKSFSLTPIYSGTSSITAVFWCDLPGSMGSATTYINYTR